jgi:hypothetical protein
MIAKRPCSEPYTSVDEGAAAVRAAVNERPFHRLEDPAIDADSV